MSVDHLERRLQHAARELRGVAVDTPPLRVGAEPDAPSGRVAHKLLLLAAPVVVALATIAVVLAITPHRATEPIAAESAGSAEPVVATASSDVADVFAESADPGAATSDDRRDSADRVVVEPRVETRTERGIESAIAPAFGAALHPLSEMDAERLASKIAGSPATVAPQRPMSAMDEKLLVSGLA